LPELKNGKFFEFGFFVPKYDENKNRAKITYGIICCTYDAEKHNIIMGLANYWQYNLQQKMVNFNLW
jgi:hypothetical protein